MASLEFIDWVCLCHAQGVVVVSSCTLEAKESSAQITSKTSKALTSRRARRGRGWWLSEVGLWLSELGEPKAFEMPLFKKLGGFKGVARPLGKAWPRKVAVSSFQLAVFRESQGNGEFSRVGSRKGISDPLSFRSSVVHSLPQFPVARCSMDVSPRRGLKTFSYFVSGGLRTPARVVAARWS